MVDPAIRVVFMGSSAFAVPALESVVTEGYNVVGVVTQPPRPAGRGRKVTEPPTMAAAGRLGLRILYPEKLRVPEAVAELAELRPELIVVAAYAQILPRSVLDMAPHGCLNIHGSLLPRWRGASPMQASILAGDSFTGVSLMLMEPTMDTGPVIAQSMTRIEDTDTTASLEPRLAAMGAALLSSTLPCYLAGGATAVPQDERKATYAQIIKKEQGLVDWHSPARSIWLASRAFYPWPSSYTHWNGRVLKLLRCRVAGEGEATMAVPTTAPGSVAAIESGRRVAVATGAGFLELHEVALEGSRPMGVREFLQGHRDFVGSSLG